MPKYNKKGKPLKGKAAKRAAKLERRKAANQEKTDPLRGPRNGSKSGLGAKPGNKQNRADRRMLMQAQLRYMPVEFIKDEDHSLNIDQQAYTLGDQERHQPTSPETNLPETEGEFVETQIENEELSEIELDSEQSEPEMIAQPQPDVQPEPEPESESELEVQLSQSDSELSEPSFKHSKPSFNQFALLNNQEVETDGEPNTSEQPDQSADQLPDELELKFEDFEISSEESSIHSMSESELSGFDDYMQHVDDIDDETIFQMASRDIDDFGDVDVFDKYDEFDEHIDSILDEGVTPPVPRAAKSSDRKRAKRQIRQMLHTTKFGKVPPLWIKYPVGMDLMEVAKELFDFIDGTQANITFPPLRTDDNKHIKHIATKLGMTTVIKRNNKREAFLVCTRTTRTRKNGKAHPNSFRGKNSRICFRTDCDKKFLVEFRRDKEKKQPLSGASVKPKEGKIVGEGVSAIDHTNFGHQLMRKMGWSEGSGLGPNLSGIMDPVQTVIKISKRGLAPRDQN